MISDNINKCEVWDTMPGYLTPRRAVPRRVVTYLFRSPRLKTSSREPKQPPHPYLPARARYNISIRTRFSTECFLLIFLFKPHRVVD